MSVNIDDDVVDVISCVALFHEKGKSGNSFLRKEKFRVQLPRKRMRIPINSCRLIEISFV